MKQILPLSPTRLTLSIGVPILVSLASLSANAGLVKGELTGISPGVYREGSPFSGFNCSPQNGSVNIGNGYDFALQNALAMVDPWVIAHANVPGTHTTTYNVIFYGKTSQPNGDYSCEVKISVWFQE